MNKRVLFFISSMEEGGAQRVVTLLVNELVNRNYDVEILKYFDTKEFYSIDNRVKVSSVIGNTKTNNILANLKYIHKYFKNNCDLIISFLAPFNIISLIANKGNNIPIVVADRNDPRRVPNKPYLRKLRNILYKDADRIVLQTNNNKEYFNEYVKRKSVVIENPIFLEDDLVGSGLKQEKQKIIVTVGRLEKQKNQIMLINSFNRIKRKYPEYKLMIYGEGSYREEIEKRIIELSLQEDVILCGRKENVEKYIGNAEIFVLSSDYEGMPNALIEAMCIGLPVISTKVSGANDLIQNGVNGFLVGINDENDLADKLDLLLCYESLRKQIAEKAHKIYNNLNVNTIIEKWINLIENK